MYRASVARIESTPWSPPHTDTPDDDLVDESMCTVTSNAKDVDLISLHDDNDDMNIGSSVRTVDKDEEEEPVYEVLYRDWEPKPEDCIVDVELNDGAEISIDYDAYERIKRAEVEKQKRRACMTQFLCYSTVVVLFIVCFGLAIRGPNNNINNNNDNDSAADKATTRQSVNLIVSWEIVNPSFL